MAHQNRLANVHVLIFGGTSGIGFGVANMALSNGARVTISGSGQPKVDQKIEKLRSFYPSLPASHVAGYACDLRDKESMEANITALFEKATEGGAEKIDHVVFTAGDAVCLPNVQDVTVDSALAGFTIRFVAPALVAKVIATGKYVPLTTHSSLTLTGGTNTYRPFPGWTYPAAWMGAVDGLVKGLANDMQPFRVNIVIPGAIQTELLQGMLDHIGEEAGKNMARDNSLTNTFGQPEDIAEAYGYLMRDWYTTGSQVTCDGGRLLVTTSPGEMKTLGEER
ncbi:NAD(P)-binding protein [Setomelanomma holmii]|uniref:NAD(P)-binding protein n=1 Tax=Setomelanomma holmii TaxID=210430 RepID=A0A9P4H8H5_9PLEO|nr:NAD(P)-binding protein [Setomelanomma holmii]